MTPMPGVATPGYHLRGSWESANKDVTLHGGAICTPSECLTYWWLVYSNENKALFSQGLIKSKPGDIMMTTSGSGIRIMDISDL